MSFRHLYMPIKPWTKLKHQNYPKQKDFCTRVKFCKVKLMWNVLNGDRGHNLNKTYEVWKFYTESTVTKCLISWSRIPQNRVYLYFPEGKFEILDSVWKFGFLSQTIAKIWEKNASLRVFRCSSIVLLLKPKYKKKSLLILHLIVDHHVSIWLCLCYQLPDGDIYVTFVDISMICAYLRAICHTVGISMLHFIRYIVIAVNCLVRPFI